MPVKSATLNNIMRITGQIRRSILFKKMVENWISRMRYIRAIRGGHK